MNVREILVVHHSHTDWGYTSHPAIVEQRHYQYIDEAVALCRPNADRDPALRYRWTCECAWVVQGYLRARSARQRRAFLECVARGDIEVAGLPLQPTPLADDATIRATLGMLDELRAEGIPISVALGCDINGLSWPWADALLDAKVNALGMAMNFVCGGGLKRWTAFQWQAASGRKLLCWQGTHYNHGAYWGLNHEAYPTSAVAPLRIAELRRYPYEKLLLQVTNIPPDNMGPHSRYLEHLTGYNKLAVEHGWPRMRTATLREWFDFLAPVAERAPTYAGDWTDWWASGIMAIGPRETATLLEAQRRAAVAERRGITGAAANAVRRQLFLAAEHTSCASSSVTAPYEVAAQAGIAAKQSLVYEAAYAANEMLRQSLQPQYVMHDRRFESFDPAWRGLVDDARQSPVVHPLRTDSPAPRPASWEKFFGKNFGQVILEKPANGSRDTWYEVGKFTTPESHGRWPVRPQWKRTPVTPQQFTRQLTGDVARFEIRMHLPASDATRALYILFPFRFTAQTVLADVGGAWANPRLENIPGSCQNWWTVHRGILMTSQYASLLWTSWDVPVIMFDKLCPSPPKPRNRLRPPVLIAWAYHNYWGTNFPVHAAGDLKFRFRIKFWPRRVTVAEAEQFCDTDPLADYPDVAEIKTT
jgi:hypothetical protein